MTAQTSNFRNGRIRRPHEYRNGDYEPSNCRWATSKEQARNTRSNKFLTHNGKTQTEKDWELELGLANGAMYYRTKSGWSHDEIFMPPYSRRKSKPK